MLLKMVSMIIGLVKSVFNFVLNSLNRVIWLFLFFVLNVCGLEVVLN